MTRLASWTGKRVTLVCAAWLLGAPTIAAIGILLGGVFLDLFSGSREVHLTVNLNGWSIGIWLFVPPVALVCAWLLARRRD